MKIKKKSEKYLSISELWNLRLLQKNEECALELGRLKARLKTTKMSDSSSLENQNFEIEISILEASLLRAHGKLEESNRRLLEIDHQYSRYEIPRHFQFYFQKGINSMVACDYSLALDWFLRAKDLGNEPKLRTLALQNALICADNLGIKLQGLLLELENTLSEKSLDQSFIRLVKQHLQALNDREILRTGSFSQLSLSTFLESESMQRAYFRYWISELPFHTQYRQFSEKNKERVLLASPDFHQKGYRIRTLQGVVSSQDVGQFVRTDFADRLYLWVWRWLQNPHEYQIRTVMSLLPSLQSEWVSEQLALEDFAMTRNSLAWLSLFDPSSSHGVQRMIQKLRSFQVSTFSWFDFEYQVIEWLTARRDNRTLEAEALLLALKKHELWTSSDHYLLTLVCAINDPHSLTPGDPLSPLGKRLFRLVNGNIHTRDLSKSTKGLVIDLASGELHWQRPAGAVISSTMSIAFDLLQRKGSVSCESLLKRVFRFVDMIQVFIYLESAIS